MSYYAYPGPLGEVVRHFIASKDGFLIGTYNPFGEAMESLAWKGRTKKHFSSLKPWSVPDLELLLQSFGDMRRRDALSVWWNRFWLAPESLTTLGAIVYRLSIPCE
jgi:hypothetical protein